MQLHSISVRLAGAALLLLAAAPAAAVDMPNADSAPNANSNSIDSGPGEGAKPAAQPKRICRTIDASESRMRAKRICMTAEEWKRADRG
ncbi:MAG: hypothetical protein ACJ8ER_02365 [Allosphingosinicella sp.]